MSLLRVVLAGAALCFISGCWQFTRGIGSAMHLVDVSPRHTVLPLLLFVLVAWVGRRNPERAARAIVLVALAIVVLTAAALPIAMNAAISNGRLGGAWPLDWVVPVQVHIRTY